MNAGMTTVSEEHILGEKYSFSQEHCSPTHTYKASFYIAHVKTSFLVLNTFFPEVGFIKDNHILLCSLKIESQCKRHFRHSLDNDF